MSAAQALLDRGWGKPAQPHTVEEGDIRVTVSARLGAVDPHAMQNDRELTSDRYLGLAKPVALGELCSPSLHGGPFRDAGQQNPGRFIGWPRNLAQLFSEFANGKIRIRRPVALNIALATAGPIGGTPGSPTPVGGAEDFTM